MKPSTKDVAEGKLHQAKGKIKEKVGHAMDKPLMENEGKNEHDAGKVQEKVGQVEKVFGS